MVLGCRSRPVSPEAPPGLLRTQISAAVLRRRLAGSAARLLQRPAYQVISAHENGQQPAMGACSDQSATPRRTAVSRSVRLDYFSFDYSAVLTCPSSSVRSQPA